MPSLLIVILVLQVVIHLVNTIGKATVNAIAWNLYNRLPTPTSAAVKEQKKLQGEFLALRKQLNSTSSQDEFAKWAKLRRQHDKLVEALEKNKATLASSKTKFDTTISTLLWLSTNGLRFFLQFWYSKVALFWLPRGWVPYYGEWLLSFPKAPLGSVSVQAWMLACASVVLLLSDAMVGVWGLAIASRAGGVKKGEKEKATVPASVRRGKGEKKEL